MAAGDLIAAALADLDPDRLYMAEIGGVLFGDGDPWTVRTIDGLGEVVNRIPRSDLQLADGDATGFVTQAPGAVTIEAIAGSDSVTDMEDAIEEARDAWAVTGAARWSTVQLHILKGDRHIYVVGHPEHFAPTYIYAGGAVSGFVATFSKSVPTEFAVQGGS